MSEFEEKVLELLEKIDIKLDKMLGSSTTTLEPVKIPTEIMPETKEVETEKEPELETTTAPVEEEQAVEGRRVCPECGSTEFNQIEDKSQILHSMGGIKIYKKNYQCKKCGKIL